jgi:excisionase family DNA binding protein
LSAVQGGFFFFREDSVNQQKQEATKGKPSSLLTVKQVAELLNIRSSTVYEWVRMDYIPCIRLGVGKEKPLVRFDAAEVNLWLNRKKEAGRTTRLPSKFAETA